ncbi:hypothetical protein L208DRAFT_1269963, partial [Tricholoma matsutake]
LIMCTFTFAHVKDLEDIEDRSDEKPIGALILSMQVVGRALALYGKDVRETSSAAYYFSADNYGNWVTHKKGSHGQWKNVAEQHATAFMPTIKGWTQECWDEIIAKAKSFLPEKKKKNHGQSSSCASSEGIDIEDDIIIVSNNDKLD